MGNYYDKDGIYHEIEGNEFTIDGFAFKGSSTKQGATLKQIVKRRKKNKNRKTHLNK